MRRSLAQGGYRAGDSSAVAALMAATAVAAPLARAQQAGTAEFVFRGGRVLTMTGNKVAEAVAVAVAVAGGRITFVGSDAGAGAHIGTGTDVVELRGRTLMPGIHDGHMHPLSGGLSLTKPTLKYHKLDLREFVAAIRKLLARGADQEPDGWLYVDLWGRSAWTGSPRRRTSPACRRGARFSSST